MASSNDNTMARFLFAILQQKNLKDIDWNQVAHSPILTQPITNGHAARMRYSRFRQTIMGHDPKPRNRNSAKSKVTKSKKESKSKKDKDEQIKPEPSLALEAHQHDPATESSQIKNEILIKTESQPPRTDARLTPADVPSNPPVIDAHIHYQNRLLTPCSDSDIFGPTHTGFATSPLSRFQQDQPFNYAGAASPCAGHDPNMYQPSPSPLSLFQFDIECYNGSTYGGQQHPQHTSQLENFALSPSEMMASASSHAPVKHEDWDHQA
ncbi:unnamed protein product [Discula destructiva]